MTLAAAAALLAGLGSALAADGAPSGQATVFPDVPKMVVTQHLDGPPIVYSTRRKPDPFRPAKAGNLRSERELNIGDLEMVGTVHDESERVVVLRSHTGSRFGYVLRGGVLIGDDNTVVPGISGDVDDKRVVLRQGPRVIEFPLSGR